MIKKIISILMITISIAMLTCNSFAFSSTVTPFISETQRACISYNGSDLDISVTKYTDKGKTYFFYRTFSASQAMKDITYTLKNIKKVENIDVWKVLLSGYPYKSYTDLLCNNEFEAYSATQVAVLAASVSDNELKHFTAKSNSLDKGERILQAAKTIINSSKAVNSELFRTFSINPLSTEWQQDVNDNRYISKDFSIDNNKEFNVSLSDIDNNLSSEIRIVDSNYQDKSSFGANETFKIMIPINKLTDAGNFKINVSSKGNVDFMYLGYPDESMYPNYDSYYIMTDFPGDNYENISDTFPKNETKIIVENQDTETLEKLKDFEFEIINDNNEVIYPNLKTDDEGKIQIENVLPGKYFLKETNVPDEYVISNEMIPIEINFNDIITAIFNNKKGEKPVTQVDKTNKTLETIRFQDKNVKKLPITGM